MKIAFVGKGGSGKSTLTALFIRYLQGQGCPIMAIDADLNMNLAGLLGVQFPREKALAAPTVADTIRGHLKGENTRIADISKFLPTTPPGTGSKLIRRYDDPALDFCSVSAGENLRLLTVGTYERESIGQHCYHSDLFVAENLLSHTVTGESFDVVCDMVAGTDAFAYSMHLQFDAIVLIAEPTPESAEVCELYISLAKDVGMESLVHLVANKVADEDDYNFIREKTGLEPLGQVSVMPELKKARQRGSSITHVPVLNPLMKIIERVARQPAISEADRLGMLIRLHEKLNDKKWVKLAYGDVSGQIDKNFDVEEAA